MRLKYKKVLSAIVAIFASTAAQATDGYFQHGYGVKSQGAGGVGIALPQDSLASATNPAGIALIENRVDGGLTWFSPSRGAEIVNSGAGVNGNLDGDGKRHFFLPEFGYVRQISPSLSAGIAVYGNGGMNTSYKKGVPLYGTGEAGVNLEQLFISPSIAWKVNEAHAFGLALNFAYQRFEAKGLQNFDNPFFTSSPGNVTNRGTDTSTGWGVRLGWTGKITSDLTLGATWAPKISMQKFQKYKGLFAEGGGFDIPENYGVGVAYQISPSLTVAADAQRILYGDVDSVGAPLSNIGNQLGTANGPGFGWANTTAYKIGAVYAMNEKVTLRAGYNHTNQPIPSSQTLFNILAPGVVQDHISVGATFKLASNSELSFAYTHALKKKVKGNGSIPPAFGGGDANIYLQENILGIAYGHKF